VNGMRFDRDGRAVRWTCLIPAANLLSLASGGAIYVRDPHRTLVEEQLNGAMYAALTAADWS